MTGPGAVVFDLDGTLIDSLPDLHAALSEALGAAGLPPVTMAQTRSFIGHGAPALVEQALAALGEDPALREGLLERLLAVYAAAHSARTRLYPGVPDALATLAQAGHRLAICTNKPEAPARAILGDFGLTARFAVVIGGDSLPTRKPDPAMLHRAVADLGGGPALYVGDSEVDAQTAVAARLPFALYTEGYRKTPVEALPHQAAFGDFAALPGIVAALLGR